MPAYLLIQATITDQEAYGSYRKAVVPLIQDYGGEIVRNEPARLLEGPVEETAPTLILFPSTAALDAFWGSAAYAEVKALRDGAADLIVWVIA